MILSTPAPAKKPLIYVVEDDPVTLALLKSHVKKGGYEVEGFSSAQSAREAMVVKLPDLVMLDLGLPDIPGIEVLRLLRKKYSPNDLPVLVVSARTAVEQVVEAFSCGANDFVSKPIRPEELRARMNTLLYAARLHKEVGRLKHMEGLSLAIATLAHEINNPLAIASGYAHAIQNGIGQNMDPADQKKKLDRLVVAISRISEVVKKITDALDGELVEEEYHESTKILKMK